MGHWEDEEAGRTEMVVEQVGHHPPCTAIYVTNAKYGVKVIVSLSSCPSYFWTIRNVDAMVASRLCKSSLALFRLIDCNR